MRRSAWRVVQAAIGIAIVAVAARSLLRNWDQLQRQPLVWEVRPALLVASALVTWAMYAVLIAAWRAVLVSWGQRLDGWTAARIWTVSSLGKYLPGKVWAIAGMAMMAQQAGVAGWAATGSAVILQALAVGTGALIVGLTGAAALEAAWPGARLLLLLLAAASAAGVGLVLWPPFTARLVRLVSREPAGAPRVSGIALGGLANVLAWTGYGVAFWLLARGLLPEARLDLVTAVAVFTASYLAGFLALIAPGGIGVRESVFILMLQGPLGIVPATALAVASRLLLTVTEFGAAVPFVLFPREKPRVAH